MPRSLSGSSPRSEGAQEVVCSSQDHKCDLPKEMPRSLSGSSPRSEGAQEVLAERSSPKSGDPAHRTVIAANLPRDLDWEDIRSAFSPVGVVELCLFVDEIMALITFSTAEAAQQAVETYDGGELNGQCIALKVNDGSLSRTTGDQLIRKRTLLVTNIPPDLHWRHLKSSFSLMGKVEVCRSKGARAEIIYRTAAAAHNAIATMHGSHMNGNRIAVRYFDAASGVILTD
jgi:RNA recognition motif-containing protein